MTGTGEPLGRKMAAGAAWMVAFKLIDRAVGLVSLLILARLLVPADFGLVAMATAVVALLELLNAFGFDVALIAHRDPQRTHYDTAWTFNVIAGSVIALLMVALAWPAAAFYGDGRLVPLVAVLAIAAALQGWENIGPVAFRRDLEFNKEFRYLLLRRLGSVAVAIPAAVLLRNYWALVCGILAGRATAVAASYWVHPYRPRLTLEARAELFGFSRWMLVNNLLSFLKERSPDFVIGRMLGPGPLGTYNLGAEIANMPTAEMSAPINRAMLPGYAAADRATSLAQTYVSTLGALALFVIPAGCGLMSLAEPIVVVLLGEKWRAAVPVLAIMAIHGSLAALQSLGYTLMIASNRPSIPARLNIGYVVVLLALLIALTDRSGLVGAATAYLATMVLMAPVVFFILTRLIGIRVRDGLNAVWRPAVASGAMIGVLKLWHGATVAREWDPLWLLASVLIGAGTYLVVLAALWLAVGRPTGPERACLELLRARRVRVA